MHEREEGERVGREGDEEKREREERNEREGETEWMTEQSDSSISDGKSLSLTLSRFICFLL